MNTSVIFTPTITSTDALRLYFAKTLNRVAINRKNLKKVQTDTERLGKITEEQERQQAYLAELNGRVFVCTGTDLAVIRQLEKELNDLNKDIDNMKDLIKNPELLKLKM